MEEEGREPLVVDPTEFMTKLRYALTSYPGSFSHVRKEEVSLGTRLGNHQWTYLV